MEGDDVQSIVSATRFKVIKSTSNRAGAPADKRFDFQGIACTSMQSQQLADIARNYNVDPTNVKATVCAHIRQAALTTELTYRLALSNKK